MFFAPRAIRRNQSGGQPARKPGGVPGASPPHQATTDSEESSATAAVDDGADAASLKRKSRWDATGPNGVPKLTSSATAATASRATTAANSERRHDATTESSPSMEARPVQSDSDNAASSLASNSGGAASQLDDKERKRKHWEAIQAKLRRGKSQPSMPSTAASTAPASVASSAGPAADAGAGAGADAAAAAAAAAAPLRGQSGSARHGQKSARDGSDAIDLSEVEPIEQGSEMAAAAATTPPTLAPASGPAVAAPVAADSSVNPAQPSPVAKGPYDMFGETDEPGLAAKKLVAPGSGIKRDAGIKTPVKVLAEDAVDKSGYYQVRPGEVMNSRYRVVSEIGRGVFSCVISCIDVSSSSGKNVAIKMIKNNETMHKAAIREIEILTRLKKDDPAGKKHCVTMTDSFYHAEHATMVFPRYAMNLRQVLKKYGRGVGIKLDALRVYAAQLLTALKQLRHLGVVHADIKPDNVLVTGDKRKVVLCDFGSADDVKNCEITPYLVSRYYRAPEISMGHEYDCAIDVWAIATTLFEMYTGDFMFKGESNNDMLRMIQDVKGPFSTKMIRRSTLRDAHFEEATPSYLFIAHPTKHEKKTRKINYTKPTKDLFEMLCPKESQIKKTAIEVKRIQYFKDLLDKMMTLDPNKRTTAEHALVHPFFSNY